MDERDLLIQRFLDQDLTSEERAQFLEAVDADSALRRQWLNLEMVIAEAGRLPRIAPSRHFTAGVLAKLDAKPKGLVSLFLNALTASHTLRWNLAGAMAAACVAVIAVVGLLRLTPDRIGKVPVASHQAQTVSMSSSQDTKVFVRLVLLQPGAQSVAIAGDFNGWNPSQTNMERVDGGMWTTTIQLKPGRYQYMFVIDGKQWIADPLAKEDAGDGFGAQNAVLDVTTL